VHGPLYPREGKRGIRDTFIETYLIAKELHHQHDNKVSIRGGSIEEDGPWLALVYRGYISQKLSIMRSAKALAAVSIAANALTAGSIL